MLRPILTSPVAADRKWEGCICARVNALHGYYNTPQIIYLDLRSKETAVFLARTAPCFEMLNAIVYRKLRVMA